MPSAIAAGDVVTLRAGCDKQFSTCREKFLNAVNFRGFPHIPGDDFVLSYARSGDPRMMAEAATPATEASMIEREMIAQMARGWIGTPYLHQASVKGVGTDCLGLVRGVWREIFDGEPESVPPYAPGWAEAGAGETLVAAARRHLDEIATDAFGAGDVLLFRFRPHLPARHAGIATSATHMIHAQDHAKVSEIALSPWWRRRLSHAFRFPGVAA